MLEEPHNYLLQGLVGIHNCLQQGPVEAHNYPVLGLVEPHSYLVAWVRPDLTPKRRTGQAGHKGTVKKMREKFITWSKDGRTDEHGRTAAAIAQFSPSKDPNENGHDLEIKFEFFF